MSKEKSQRVDTAQGALNSMKDATTEILPPEHVSLEKGDMPFWRSIMKTRAASLWTLPDLEIAANLARCKAHIERVQEILRVEGDVVTNARGTQILNPRHQLLEQLTNRCIRLTTKLHLHAEATSGKAPKEAKKNQAAAQAGQIAQAAEDDDLIAKPPMVN